MTTSIMLPTDCALWWRARARAHAHAREPRGDSGPSACWCPERGAGRCRKCTRQATSPPAPGSSSALFPRARCPRCCRSMDKRRMFAGSGGGWGHGVSGAGMHLQKRAAVCGIAQAHASGRAGSSRAGASAAAAHDARARTSFLTRWPAARRVRARSTASTRHSTRTGAPPQHHTCARAAIGSAHRMCKRSSASRPQPAATARGAQKHALKNTPARRGGRRARWRASVHQAARTCSTASATRTLITRPHASLSASWARHRRHAMVWRSSWFGRTFCASSRT